MIKARFQQRRKGVLYKKGDVIRDHSEKEERELIKLRQADYCPPKRVIKKYPVKDEKGTWYTLSNGRRVQGKAAAQEAEEAL